MTAASMVELDTGVSLSYSERGDADVDVPLVLLPGPTDSWRSYEPVMAHLPDSTRVIAMSPRGHGDSEKPLGGYGVEDLALDVVAFLDALRVDRAVLVAHSGACLAARWVAINRQPRVAGLVLEASPLTLRGDPELESFVTTVVADLRDPIDPDFLRSFLADTSSSTLPSELVEVLVSEAGKVPASVWHEVFAALLIYDDTAQLKHLRSSTLLIWGDRDPIIDIHMRDALIANLPHAEVSMYEGCGHTPRWELPSRFATEVAAFAASLGAEPAG